MIEFGKQASVMSYCIGSLGTTYRYHARNHLASNISKFRYSKILKIKRVLKFGQLGLKKLSICYSEFLSLSLILNFMIVECSN